MWKPILASLSASVMLYAFASCGGNGTPVEPEPGPFVSEIYQLILDSPGLDSDGDNLPDDVELHPLLKTDPHRADTDDDGLLDNFEIFGPTFLFLATDGLAGELGLADYLRDTNRNGIHAALDPEEQNDDLMVDTDGDGVFNYLEFYGYTYNWAIDEFVKWTHEDRLAHPEVPWFKTDPMQPSTDQDAYSDGMEVSGAMMDVAIEEPGDHPLVPAYPNIVVRLEGYSVTLNDQITYSRGGSLSNGSSWSRETASTSSVSESTGNEIGVEAGVEFGPKGIAGGSVKAHYNRSWGNESTNSTTTSVAIGGSVNEEVNWNRARCYNPTEAAHIKLFLKVENCGTAPASNVIPTLNLRIGGSNVATFEQADFKINMLMPGQVYPQGNDVYWVVDSIGTGAPLSLTDFELKSLESGAPVNIAVTQMQADVMLMDKNGGWQRVGDINEYLARCQAVCANIYADLGEGKAMHHLVFADRGATSPTVTLGDALKWSMGATERNDGVFIEYRTPDGMIEEIALAEPGEEAWTVHLDSATFRERSVPTLDTRLSPGSHVELLAPRKSNAVPPQVYDAYAIPLAEGYEVVCCASDYDGIKSVVFVDRDGVETTMEPDGRGPWFFTCLVSDDYEFKGGELVRVQSNNSAVPPSEHGIGPIHTIVAEPPVISRVVYDAPNRMFRAKVEAGGDLAEDAIAWIRLYHPTFQGDNKKPDGYVELEETNYWFEDPDVYQCQLPAWKVDMRLVAQSAGGQYTVAELKDVATRYPYAYGSVLRLHSRKKWRLKSEFFEVGQVDLDFLPAIDGPKTSTHADYYSWWDSPWGNRKVFSNPQRRWPSDGIDELRKHPAADIYLRSSGIGTGSEATTFLLGCQTAGVKLDVPSTLSADTYYRDLTENEVQILSQGFEDGHASALLPGDQGSDSKSVFAFITNEGRYGKLWVRSSLWTQKNYTDVGVHNDWDRMEVTFDYVIFRKDGDGEPPPSMTYEVPEAYYSEGEQIDDNEPVFTGDGDPVDTYEVAPDLPVGLELTADGIIRGTPTSQQAQQSYTVTGTNTAGVVTATVKITILEELAALSYPSASIICATGDVMPDKNPTVTGDPDSYSIDPKLPTGLKIDEVTGAIGGTPIQVTDEITYTVTARDLAGGSTTAEIKIETPLGAPMDLSYKETSVVYTVGIDIVPNVPTVTNPVASWSVSPALPAGLSFHTTTGYISGKPTAAAASDDYVITAWNTAGSTSVTITIEVLN